MTLSHSPSIVRDGLVLYLDAANTKSLPSENLLRYSERMSVSPWSKFNNSGDLTITDNAITGPFGYSASQMNSVTWVSGNSFYQDVSISGTSRVRLSVYVKGGTSNSITLAAFFTGNSTEGFSIGFNPLTGSITGGTGTVESVGSGWYRISMVVTGTNGANNALRWQVYANNVGITYFWGAQLGYARSSDKYLKTEGSAVTNNGTWYDLSGNGRNATIYGTPTFVGTNGGKFEFSTGQIVDYISLPASALRATAASYTIEFWMQPTTSRTSYFHSVSDGANHNYMLAYANAAGAIGFYAGGNTAPFSNNEILQFSIVRTGSDTGNFYKNGVLSTTNAFTTVLSAAADGGWILNQEQDALGGSFDANQNFIGSFMGVKVYDRALTATEVKQNFNALRRRYGI